VTRAAAGAACNAAEFQVSKRAMRKAETFVQKQVNKILRWQGTLVAQFISLLVFISLLFSVPAYFSTAGWLCPGKAAL
jgi:hypothetical protein